MSKHRKLNLQVAMMVILVVTGLLLLPLGVKNKCVAAAENCEGDFDLNGAVDGTDLAVIVEDFGSTNCFTGKSFTLNEVLQRGELWVGVFNWDMSGFFEQQDTVGLEADLARALAAAIFADINKVRFIPVSAG